MRPLRANRDTSAACVDGQVEVPRPCGAWCGWCAEGRGVALASVPLRQQLCLELVALRTLDGRKHHPALMSYARGGAIPQNASSLLRWRPHWVLHVLGREVCARCGSGLTSSGRHLQDRPRLGEHCLCAAALVALGSGRFDEALLRAPFAGRHKVAEDLEA